MVLNKLVTTFMWRIGIFSQEFNYLDFQYKYLFSNRNLNFKQTNRHRLVLIRLGLWTQAMFACILFFKGFCLFVPNLSSWCSMNDFLKLCFVFTTSFGIRNISSETFCKPYCLCMLYFNEQLTFLYFMKDRWRRFGRIQISLLLTFLIMSSSCRKIVLVRYLDRIKTFLNQLAIALHETESKHF